MAIDFPYDDAYITLASAQALWQGGDPHYPDASPLHGITSPVHCAIVAALLPFLPPEWASLVSCVIGAALYAWALWSLGKSSGLSSIESAGLMLAGLGAGMIAQHLVNGLETSWALATVAWLLVASVRDHPRLLGLLAGSAPFVRPELVVLSVAVLAWQSWRSPGSARSLWLGAVMAPLPWLLLTLSQTGLMVPSSLGAKQAWYAEGCWTASRRASVVGYGLLSWMSAMPLVAIGAAGLLRTTLGRVGLASAAVILTVWAFSVPNVLHTYHRHRYFAIFLPLLMYGLSRLPPWVRPVAVAGAAVMAAVSTLSLVRFEPAAVAQVVSDRRETHRVLSSENAARVLLHDAGYLAYSNAMREGVDMVGLKTPRAMALHASITAPSCGERRGEAIVLLAEQTDPTHLVIWQPWDDYFKVTDALVGAGWRIERLASSGPIEKLQVYRLTAPRR